MATFEPLTDPSILAQLNAPAAPVAAPPPAWQPVTGPAILEAQRVFSHHLRH